MDELRGPNIQIVLHVKEGMRSITTPELDSDKVFLRIFCHRIPQLCFRTRIWFPEISFCCKRLSKWVYVRDRPCDTRTCSGIRCWIGMGGWQKKVSQARKTKYLYVTFRQCKNITNSRKRNVSFISVCEYKMCQSRWKYTQRAHKDVRTRLVICCWVC